MHRLRARLPSSYRGRIALVIAAMLVVTLGVQAAVRGIVDQRVRDDARRALQEQAAAIAESVESVPDDQKADRAFEAARFLLQTRVVVTWPAPPGLYYNVVPLGRSEAEVTATAGDVEVRLARETPSTGLSSWLIVALFVGALGTLAAMIWLLAGTLTRRLRRQVADLAASAESVASGDLAARAVESDDELGRASRAFNRMAERLEAADERQRRFLADVAHELRTPVTAIDGFAAALTDGAAATPADREEAAMFIREEAARLRDLVGDLRELTRLGLEPAVAREHVDLSAVAADVAQRLGPVADAKGVELVAERGTASAVSDLTHLETILVNLVTNAITATPSGGRVTISAGDDGAAPWFAVSDTGIGIPADHLPRIFDRLYRVDSARQRDQGGSGLGLAIVKELVGLLGGTIAVESQPGRGSTFTVRLPRVANTPPETRPTVP